MDSMLGLCPRCKTSAPVGEPCPIPACTAAGIHAIPDQYIAEGEPDPRLGRMVGDYLLVQRLHLSHLSTVYLALQMPFFMKAAVKLLQPHSDDPGLRRMLIDQFRAEATAVAALDHPNTVRLLKYGEVDGYPYLVTEYVDGGRTFEDELRARATQGKPLGLRAARHVLSQVVRVLEAAHRLGIVHADVKPGNLLLQKLPDDPLHVRLVDFGLVRHHDEDREKLHAGTPHYLAPEQITDEVVGPWTDLYALAEMAFELVVGHLPFPDPDPEAVVKAKTAPHADPLASLHDTVLPPFVLGFFRRALAREPGRRFSNTAEFRDALEWVFDALEAVSEPSDAPDAEAFEVVAPDPQPTGVIGPHATDIEERKRQLLQDLENSFLNAEAPGGVKARMPRSRLYAAITAVALLVVGGFALGAVLGNWLVDARARRVEIARQGVIPPPLQVAVVASTEGPDASEVEGPDATAATNDDDAPATAETGDDGPGALPDGREPAWVEVAEKLSFTRTETTVRAYRACVAAAACTPPGAAEGCSGQDPARDLLPVTCVDGFQARVYCRWAGGRLPSPEEWQAVATDVGRRTWPWGDEAPTCDRAVMKDGQGPGCGTKGPFPVCSHPAGASVQGLCDLTGNVAEWTAGTDGDDQVYLGGGWRDPADLLDVGLRSLRVATESDVDLGFRCAR